MNLLHFLAELPKKQLYYILAVVIGFCLIAGVIFHVNNKTKITIEDRITVRTLTIHTAENAQEYTYAGEVRGRFETQLAFQVTGKIIKRNVELGSKVNAGDTLMQIDAKDIQQTVNSNSAQIASAQSQLSLAESNLTRYRQLLAQGAISQSMYDQYVNAYNVAVAGVNQASSQYTQGANQLDYTVLRADKAGVVSSITAETGQVVSGGQSVITVVQDGEQEVEINVPENRIKELHNAEQIKTIFWALPNVTVDGKIREIAPMADQNTRTFKVRISLINPPPEVKLGMTASIQVAYSSAQQSVTIPLAAVYQDSTTPAVWIVKDDVLTLQPITTGKFGNGTIEVLSGLKQGDCIVIAGVHKLKEGQKVRAGGDSL
ncbi:efflux RND transporter periplasmic adaptor subunit [Anaerosinus massiliensis]|uniref:efflux RND transporter periplasmic adaptor subunit n=1 Tax=Massilibacillus massiliensis TaxID=1806837 RepID=UPI000A70C88E|nr:efflux RND transporter periplasmic adaptor subunit [Massilibacillus massiliensis]